eukprot:CAMPEP_0197702262 /NCGR_PEP_ID=MMETSP1338-20131121/124279_1 /TAXON_ID=43686 ORGANISM="Pelagodinium beii, Strain RCC1491" /NCGR_SAMPLE_ID=MMETSP1338 /ASSEMBLY_ACC=CAM_ASM_000754 /LENGTH=350 /DNA_ID=CAMNT_0043286071 /DNA_START=58 /DNA_END=1106 /DNA_ORIENTATION=+
MRFTTDELSAVQYELRDDEVVVYFYQDGKSIMGAPIKRCVAELKVVLVEISFYAKQHLQKKPPLLECGVNIVDGHVDKFLIPTERRRTAGNGSIAVKYYDVTKAISEDEVEPYERVGIRLPTGVFTYAFFECQYLARAEDPRRGALFLINPAMIVVQQTMTNSQKKEFQTFGGSKVLYFDVLDEPNLQERDQEMKLCRIRRDEQKKRYEEADKKWEEEMEQRLVSKAVEDAAKPKQSKKAKQKARQAAKNGKPAAQEVEFAGEVKTEAEAEDLAEQERLHKQRQAEKRAKVEEELKLVREAEAHRKKLEAAEAKRAAEAESSRMSRIKNLLQKVQSSMSRSEASQGLTEG